MNIGSSYERGLEGDIAANTHVGESFNCMVIGSNIMCHLYDVVLYEINL